MEQVTIFNQRFLWKPSKTFNTALKRSSRFPPDKTEQIQIQESSKPSEFLSPHICECQLSAQNKEKSQPWGAHRSGWERWGCSSTGGSSLFPRCYFKLSISIFSPQGIIQAWALKDSTECLSTDCGTVRSALQQSQPGSRAGSTQHSSALLEQPESQTLTFLSSRNGFLQPACWSEVNVPIWDLPRACKGANPAAAIVSLK